MYGDDRSFPQIPVVALSLIFEIIGMSKGLSHKNPVKTPPQKVTSATNSACPGEQATNSSLQSRVTHSPASAANMSRQRVAKPSCKSPFQRPNPRIPKFLESDLDERAKLRAATIENDSR